MSICQLHYGASHTVIFKRVIVVTQDICHPVLPYMYLRKEGGERRGRKRGGRRGKRRTIQYTMTVMTQHKLLYT